MRVALHCGMPADALFHSEQLLKTILSERHKTQSKEIDRGNFERAILMSAEAAIALSSEERLIGLQPELEIDLCFG